MPEPEDLRCFISAKPYPSAQWFKIYQALGGTMDLRCFISLPQPNQLYLIYDAISGGEGSSIIIFEETPPVDSTDFSMFPDGVIPTSGVYQAMDDNWIYTLDTAIDTEWQKTPRAV